MSKHAGQDRLPEDLSKATGVKQALSDLIGAGTEVLPVPRMRRLARLYHLAEADNVVSILEHGLMSTERLLDLVGLTPLERAMLLRSHRPDGMRLSATVRIRDQRPIPPAALARALLDGLEPADWYDLLNRHVFFLPRLGAYRAPTISGGQPQMLFTYDGEALLYR